MRQYILTDNDRRRLLEWLESGKEDQVTYNLFTQIRKSFPRLVKDIRLLLIVRRRLNSQGRWKGRIRVPSDFKNSLIKRLRSK